MEVQSETGEKRKYYKDNPLAVKRRNTERKEKGRAKEGRIAFQCINDAEKKEIFSIVQDIKSHLGEGNPNNVTSKAMLLEVFSSYKNRHLVKEQEHMETTDANEKPFLTVPSHQSLAAWILNVKEQMFLTSPSSVNNLVTRIEKHSRICKEAVSVSATTYRGHAAILKRSCSQKHEMSWSSMPYLGTKFLCNQRMLHGYFVSGILPNQYKRLCIASGIGCVGDAAIAEVFKSYKDVVADGAKDSCYDAIMEEKETYGDNYEGINILTDARHGTRKNSYHSDIVCIGANSHKVLRAEHVNKKDCASSQKHEMIGTQRIYDFFDNFKDNNESDTGIAIKFHCHDKKNQCK